MKREGMEWIHEERGDEMDTQRRGWNGYMKDGME